MLYCQLCEPDHPGGYGWSPAFCVEHAPKSTEYIRAPVAAEQLNVSPDRMRHLCAEGKIVGARKIGRDWLIPTPIQRIPGRNGRPPALDSARQNS